MNLNFINCLNCNYVDQSEFKFSKNKLYTSHVGTCSVLVFRQNNLNFMAHVDAMQTNSQFILNFIKNNTYNFENIHAIIIKGPWCTNSCKSIQNITQSLNELSISYSFYPYKIKWNSVIYFDNGIEIK